MAIYFHRRITRGLGVILRYIPGNVDDPRTLELYFFLWAWEVTLSYEW